MASVSGVNTIVLKAAYPEGGSQHEEGIISGTPSPGMAVQRTPAASVDGRDTWAVAGTDYLGTGTGVTAVKGPVCVLKEDGSQGKTVDDAYVSGENCFVHRALPGDILQVLVASGQDINKTNGMSAGTNGKFSADTTNPSVMALEDTGGALGADTLVRVEVL